MPKAPLNFLLSVFLLCSSPSPVWAQAQVLASIKPLQLIASAITEGVSTPQVLIPANQSPHHFSLKPSDVSRLVGSDVILWVGPGLETWLTGVLQQAGRNQSVLTAASLPGMTLLAADEQEHDHGHADADYDPHLWLDTRNAALIARALATSLVQTDAQNAARYESNLDRFESSLQALDEQLAIRFEDLQEVPFAVYHNGTHYFETQQGLQHQFVLVPNHEIQPGMRHLLDLRTRLDTLSPVCLLEDINTNAATVDTVFRDAPLRRVMLDTLGENVAPSPDAYVQLISTLAAGIAQCLRP